MIRGVTDRRVIRRDGKIRSGHKGSKGEPVNDPHFLLHDAPQLIPVLGENPKEIYCTFFDDKPEAIAPADLRYYTKSELVCRSTHQAPEGAEQPLNMTAAFYALGEVEGVTAKTHPWMPKARERICKYKQCPDYLKDNCSEHLFINLIVPQYSMGAMFQLETTSILTLLDVYSTLQKVAGKNLAKGGKISGEIFRVFKHEKEVPYLDGKSGKRYKSKKWLVGMQYVPYDEYIKLFGEKLKSEDREALEALRNLQFGGFGGNFQLGADEPVAQLTGAMAAAQLEGPQKSEEEILKERANDPVVLPLFDELSKLVGRNNTEDARVNTAKNFADVGTMIDYLKKKIAEVKKKQSQQPQGASLAGPQQQSSATTEKSPPPAAAQNAQPPAQQGQPIDENLLGG